MSSASSDRYVVKNDRGQYADGRRGWVNRQKDAFVFDQLEGEEESPRQWAFTHKCALYAFSEVKEGTLRLARLYAHSSA